MVLLTIHFLSYAAMKRKNENLNLLFSINILVVTNYYLSIIFSTLNTQFAFEIVFF